MKNISNVIKLIRKMSKVEPSKCSQEEALYVVIDPTSLLKKNLKNTRIHSTIFIVSGNFAQRVNPRGTRPV